MSWFMGRLARRRRARARAAARPGRRAARHHDGPARARLGPAGAERRLGDRRRLRPEQVRDNAAASGIELDAETLDGDRRDPALGLRTMSRRKLRSQGEVVERCRAMRSELQAALARAARGGGRPGGRRRRLARRGARHAPLGAPARRAADVRPSLRPGDRRRARPGRRQLAGGRGHRARARFRPPVALAGADDRAAGGRQARAAAALRDVRPADRRDGDARLRAGRPPVTRCGAISAPTARSTATWRPSSTPRPTRSPSSATTRSTGSAARARAGTTSRSTRDIDFSISDRMTESIDAYADLIVRVGANVQPGQTVFVNALVEHAPLARAIARAGVRRGRALRRRPLRRPPRPQGVHRERAPTRTSPRRRRGSSRASRRSPTAAPLILIAGDPEPELLADVDQARVGKARAGRGR